MDSKIIVKLMGWVEKLTPLFLAALGGSILEKRKIKKYTKKSISRSKRNKRK